MSTKNPSHPTTLESITDCNQSVARHLGMTARSYKILMALTKLLAVIVGGAALVTGADPTTTVIVIGSIAAGPDVVEAILADSKEE